MQIKAQTHMPSLQTGTSPLYKRIRDDIARRIAQGEWKPGEALPIERELSASYNVGIATIRTAIGELVASNIVDRRQGKGTFVSSRGVESDIYRFFHVVRNDGVRELPKSELISLRKVRADDATADALRLPRNAQDIYKIRNALAVSNDRVVVSDLSIPSSLFPGLSEGVIKTGGQTLYAVYQNHYGVMIVRTVEKLRAVRGPADIAKLLRIPASEPVIQAHRVAYTIGNVPVEVRSSWIRTDEYHYLLDQGSAV